MRLLLVPLLLASSSVFAQGAADKVIPVTLRQRFVIGGAADTSFAPAMLFASFVATDNAGHLYVVDRAESRVIEFDGKGAQVRVLGRKGRGPGELASPFAIGIAADKSISVYDGGKRAFVRFGADGKPLAEVPNRLSGFVQQVVAIDGDAYVLYATVRYTSVLIRVRGEAMERMASLAPPPQRPTPVFEKPCGMVGSESPPMLHEQLRAAGRGGVIVYSIASTWAFTVMEPGKAPRVVSRDRAPEKLTPAIARRFFDDSSVLFVANRRCAVPTSAIIEQAGIGRFVPPYERFVLDGKGYVWATRMTERGAAGLADVYSLAGGYVGTAKLGKAKPIAFLSDGALVSLEEDDDVPMLVVYDVSGFRR